MKVAYRTLLCFLGLLLIFGVTPQNIYGQCLGASTRIGSISGMTGNPFEADIKQSYEPTKSGIERSLEPMNQHVARDSQGRVRTDLNQGKFRVQNGAGEGTEQEQHQITICDPVNHQWILLDTLNKLATVRKLNPGPTPPNGGLHVVMPSIFCSWQLRTPPNVGVESSEELDHRTIEGLDAVGVLQRRASQRISSGANSSSSREFTPVIETWCSEEIGAIILRVIGSEEKGASNSLSMVNIQRTEPDPTVFQIPPDYRIIEKVN